MYYMPLQDPMHSMLLVTSLYCTVLYCVHHFKFLCTVYQIPLYSMLLQGPILHLNHMLLFPSKLSNCTYTSITLVPILQLCTVYCTQLGPHPQCNNKWCLFYKHKLNLELLSPFVFNTLLGPSLKEQ